jgi:predicted O-methyltransferase YrrM
MFCIPGFEFFRQQLATSTHNYLEIGVFNGDSIGNLARAFPNIHIYGIDPFVEDGCTTHTTGVAEHESMPTQRENTYKNIAGLANVDLFEMFSHDFADTVTDSVAEALDVAYVLIDGSHHYADVIVDVHLAMRLIGDKPGAIVFDDVNLPGVAQAYQEFLTHYAGRYAPVQDLYDTHPGHILAHAILPVNSPAK